MNYVQQFPDIEQQLRTFLVGYIERYWLTQVGTRILSVFGCEYRTNNYLESFPSTLLTQMSKHPNIWDFIREIILYYTINIMNIILITYTFWLL